MREPELIVFHQRMSIRGACRQRRINKRSTRRGTSAHPRIDKQNSYLSKACAASCRPLAKPLRMRDVLITCWRAEWTSIVPSGLIDMFEKAKVKNQLLLRSI